MLAANVSSLSVCTILNYFSPPSPYRPSWVQRGDYLLAVGYLVSFFFFSLQEEEQILRKANLNLTYTNAKGMPLSLLGFIIGLRANWPKQEQRFSR